MGEQAINGSLSFPLEGDDAFAGIFGPIGDKIRLPTRNLRESVNHDGLAKVVFFAFKNLHTLLSAGEIAIRHNDNRNTEWSVNSRVISASISKGRHMQLVEPVDITLRHLRPVDVHTEESICVFWDFELSAWSDEGCEVVDAGEMESVCRCDHLTSFALLSKSLTSTSTGFGGADDSKFYAFLALEIVGYVVLVIIVVVICGLGYKVRSHFYSFMLYEITNSIFSF